MRIKTSTEYYEGKVYGIKAIDVEFCCDDMKGAFEENYIRFGEYPPDSILNYDSNVNIYRCFPYPEGACWDEMPIKYCPFCAEEIQIIQG